MKTIYLVILVLGLALGVFILGVLVGVNRVFPYNIVRSVSDRVRPSQVNLEGGDKVGVVLFGDSLSARGDWRVIQQSDKFEILVLAKGGLKASSFPYESESFGGEVHAFWLGMNDLLDGLDITGAYDGIMNLAEISDAEGKKIVIFGLPEPVELSDLSESVFQEYNNQLRTVCEYKGWTFIDTERLLNQKFIDRRKISSDGIHLNMRASQYVADKFSVVCEELCSS